jgi:predicted AAA+ superfamily ATPase
VILLENLIEIELLKQGKKIYFYREEVKCDFIVLEKDQVFSAVQVSLSIKEPDTRQREIRGLLAACKRFGLPEGIIITDDEEESLLEDGVQIEVVPAFKFLLD